MNHYLDRSLLTNYRDICRCDPMIQSPITNTLADFHMDVFDMDLELNETQILIHIWNLNSFGKAQSKLTVGILSKRMQNKQVRCTLETFDQYFAFVVAKFVDPINCLIVQCDVKSIFKHLNALGWHSCRMRLIFFYHFRPMEIVAFVK